MTRARGERLRKIVVHKAKQIENEEGNSRSSTVDNDELRWADKDGQDLYRLRKARKPEMHGSKIWLDS